VAINEGATLLGHYFKDGYLHFGEVGFHGPALLPRICTATVLFLSQEHYGYRRAASQSLWLPDTPRQM
jgi:hypothetical protein